MIFAHTHTHTNMQSIRMKMESQIDKDGMNGLIKNDRN